MRHSSIPWIFLGVKRPALQKHFYLDSFEFRVGFQEEVSLKVLGWKFIVTSTYLAAIWLAMPSYLEAVAELFLS